MAKLNGAVSQEQYRALGLSYLVDIARNDTVTFMLLVVGAVGAVFWTQRLLSKKAASLAPRWVAFLWGAPLYALYVFHIGGDFMAGRHWAAPFFLVVVALVLALRDSHWASRTPSRSRAARCYRLASSERTLSGISGQRAASAAPCTSRHPECERGTVIAW